jgi:hypothetical protein
MHQIITCNTSNIASFGYEFNGPASAINTSWYKNNSMTGAHYYGLFLNNGVVLGPQGIGNTVPATAPTGNTWNYTPTGNAKHTFTYNSQAINSLMTVTAGAPSEPTVNGTNVTNQEYKNFLPAKSLYPSAVNTGQGCTVPPMIPASTMPLVVPNVAAVANMLCCMTHNSMSSELNNAGRFYVYRAQRQDDQYITATPELLAFYNSTNTATHPYKKMMDIEDDIASELFTNAQTKLNAFVPANLLEVEHKSFYSLQLKFAQGTALTAADKTELTRIAKQCPHTEGFGVYAARNLCNALQLIGSLDYLSFTDDCNPSGMYKTQHLGNTATLLVEVYPNPATSELYIRVNDADVHHAKVTMLDITGKQVLQSELTFYSGRSSLAFDVAPGTYVLKLEFTNHESQVHKIIVE